MLPLQIRVEYGTAALHPTPIPSTPWNSQWTGCSSCTSCASGLTTIQFTLTRLIHSLTSLLKRGLMILNLSALIASLKNVHRFIYTPASRSSSRFCVCVLMSPKHESVYICECLPPPIPTHDSDYTPPHSYDHPNLVLVKTVYLKSIAFVPPFPTYRVPRS